VTSPADREVRYDPACCWAGKLSDLLGRKATFLIGLIGFAVASAVCGAAVSFGMLAEARACQGAFGALLAPAALSLLTVTFSDPQERGRAFAVYGAVAGAGGAVGLLLGGVRTGPLTPPGQPPEPATPEPAAGARTSGDRATPAAG
jgi:MFS family permease